MPLSQYDKHTLHCVMGSYLKIHTIRCFQLHESFVLIPDKIQSLIDFVVDLVEDHVDQDGSQFSESVVDRWYSGMLHSRMW